MATGSGVEPGYPAYTDRISGGSGLLSVPSDGTLPIPPTLEDAPPLNGGYTQPSEPAPPTITVPVIGARPAPFSEIPPLVSIDDFEVAAVSVIMPSRPEVTSFSAPVAPELSYPTIADAPSLDNIDVPTLLTLSTPTFGGVNIPDVTDAPTLELVAPSAFSFEVLPEYSSRIKDQISALFEQRLKGGTGLAADVEQAIWDRARDRELSTALANEAEIMRQSEALGFNLPAGVLAAQLREAQQAYYDKLSTLSRDVAIKQAELEQENLKQTITQVAQWETQLVELNLKRQQLTFEAAKVEADNGIQLYNALVGEYKVLLDGYNSYLAGKKLVLEGEMSKLEVYKGQLQAEQTKAQVNTTLIQQYKTQIDAQMSKVELYKANLGAAQAYVAIEQAKISAYGEEVKAYTAKVNAETSKVELYKAQVAGEQGRVEAYKAQVQAYAAKVGAQSEKAKAELGRFQALVEAYKAEWDGYKAQVQGAALSVEAQGHQLDAGAKMYAAKVQNAAADAEADAKFREAEIKLYEAQSTLYIQRAKISGEQALTIRGQNMDRSKTEAQVNAQIQAATLGQWHYSQSYGQQTSWSYNYEM